MAKFAKGAMVQQIVTPIRGKVAQYAVDQESGAVQVMVEWTDVAGQVHSRYFNEDEIAPGDAK